MRNFIAIVTGIIAGMLINIGLIMIGSSVIPPPEGVDVTNAESLRQAMPMFPPANFIFPFLAHFFGTLVGAFVVAKIATGRKMIYALVIGIVTMIGGIINSFMLPAPLWFIILDLAAAYIPAAWVGGKLGGAGTEIVDVPPPAN